MSDDEVERAAQDGPEKSQGLRLRKRSASQREAFGDEEVRFFSRGPFSQTTPCVRQGKERSVPKRDPVSYSADSQRMSEETMRKAFPVREVYPCLPHTKSQLTIGMEQTGPSSFHTAPSFGRMP